MITKSEPHKVTRKHTENGQKRKRQQQIVHNDEGEVQLQGATPSTTKRAAFTRHGRNDQEDATTAWDLKVWRSK